MFEWLTTPEAWIALGTLTALEIVLGIDNIIFLSILVGRLPEHQRAMARRLGLGLALLARLGLLFSLSWVMGLTEPWFTVFAQAISGRDLILILGGLFLLAKATHEIHNSLEGIEDFEGPAATPASASAVAASVLVRCAAQVSTAGRITSSARSSQSQDPRSAGSVSHSLRPIVRANRSNWWRRTMVTMNHPSLARKPLNRPGRRRGSSISRRTPIDQ